MNNELDVFFKHELSACASFEEANLIKSEVQMGNFLKVEFTGADLQQAHMLKASMRSANRVRGDVRDATGVAHEPMEAAQIGDWARLRINLRD